MLEAQGRRDDLERFLVTLLDRTSSLELMTDIGAHADTPRVRVGAHALAGPADRGRCSDPIDKLQLRYALVRLHESRGELDAARKALDAVYAENPRILGVVRQTADYYWRHKQGREAIAVLTRAASAVVSGAEKAVHVRGRDQIHADRRLRPGARAARAASVPDDPFNADYLAAVADTYALAKDDGSLRDFYTIDDRRDAATRRSRPTSGRAASRDCVAASSRRSRA